MRQGDVRPSLRGENLANDTGLLLGMYQPMMVLANEGGYLMKMIHVLTLFLVVFGGLHFALTGFGVDLIGTVFGTATNLTILYIVMGVSTLYHVVPMLKTHLAAL